MDQVENTIKIPIPIFIITRDRLDVLEKCVNSLQQIKSPYQIVIHDNNTTFQPLIDYLKEKEKSGEFIVYWHKVNKLTEAKISIAKYFEKVEEDPGFYIVTDPDIELKNVNGNILEFYKHLLEKYDPKSIQVIGPMLHIDDLPDYYPLKQKVIQKHTQQFWGKPAQKLEWNEIHTKIQRAKIDTTFGMYRSYQPWKPMNDGFRVHEPFSARHLDWYIDPENMSDDQKYYLNSCNRNIGHWSSSYLKPLLNKGKNPLPTPSQKIIDRATSGNVIIGDTKWQVFFPHQLAIRKTHDLLNIWMANNGDFTLRKVHNSNIIIEHIKRNQNKKNEKIILYFFSQRLPMTRKIFHFLHSLENVKCKIVVFSNDFWYWQNNNARDIVDKIFFPKNHHLFTFATDINQINTFHGKKLKATDRWIFQNIWCCYNSSILEFCQQPIRKLAVSGNIKKEPYPERYQLAQFGRNKYKENIQVLNFDQHEGISYSQRLQKFEFCFASSPHVFCPGSKNRKCAEFLVQKVFEIIAVGSLLVCPTYLKPHLEKIGLVHRVNCWLINFDNGLEKDLDDLFSQSYETVLKMRLNSHELAKKKLNSEKMWNTVSEKL